MRDSRFEARICLISRCSPRNIPRISLLSQKLLLFNPIRPLLRSLEQSSAKLPSLCLTQKLSLNLRSTLNSILNSFYLTQWTVVRRYRIIYIGSLIRFAQGRILSLQIVHLLLQLVGLLLVQFVLIIEFLAPQSILPGQLRLQIGNLRLQEIVSETESGLECHPLKLVGTY